MSQGRRVATLGVMLSLSMLMSYVETLIPFAFGVPGMKLGLPNLVIVLALYAVGAREAFLINLVRIVLTGLLFGSVISMTYGLFGGVLSFLCMLVAIRLIKLKIVTVSIIGGMAHNIGQLLAAGLYFKTDYLMFYAPVLLAAGFITGALIGIVAFVIGKRLKNVFVY